MVVELIRRSYFVSVASLSSCNLVTRRGRTDVGCGHVPSKSAYQHQDSLSHLGDLSNEPTCYGQAAKKQRPTRSQGLSTQTHSIAVPTGSVLVRQPSDVFPPPLSHECLPSSQTTP